MLRDRPGPLDREGVLVEHRLIERDAEGELIGACVGGQTAELLRRHVARGAGDRGAVWRAGGRPFAADEREAEVRDAHLPVLADQHVRRLEVAMHQPGAVRGLETGARSQEEIEPLFERVARILQPLPQGPADDQLHRHVGEIVIARPVDAGVVDGDHVRVLHARHRLRLGDDLAVRAVGRDQLERDLAIEDRIVGLPDHAHPALAEDAQKQIATERAIVVRQRRHRLRAGLLDGRRERLGVWIVHPEPTLSARRASHKCAQRLPVPVSAGGGDRARRPPRPRGARWRRPGPRAPGARG